MSPSFDPSSKRLLEPPDEPEDLDSRIFGIRQLIAALQRELAELDMPGIIHVTNAGEGTSYAGFAEKVCEVGGFDASLIEPVSHADLQRPAPRPVSSKLACLFSDKFGLLPMPDWEDGLKRFLGK